MSMNNNPKVVTNNLVMYYDANNVKSYVGPPLKNILTSITPTGISSSAGYVATTGSETVNIPTLGDTFVNYVTIQNNYSAVSTNCCPSLYQYGGGTLLPSTLYTYAIVYKCESGYTSPNFMYQYDYNGAAFVTEFGLHSTSQRTHLGGGWYWAWATFTTQATVNTLNSSGLWYYQYSTGVDKVTVAKVMMVQGNYTSLHPRYWPALNTTRSTTESIVDLTNNNTITSILTYSSTGTFSFNGTSNWIDVSSNTNTALQNSYQTISMWVNINSVGPNGEALVWGVSGGAAQTWIGWTPGGVNFWCGSNVTLVSLSSANSYNQWMYVTYIIDRVASTFTLYKNGVYVGVVSFTTYTPSATTVTIGKNTRTGNTGDFTNGSISNIQLYNRSLSAAEVAQNFNALRGRYLL